MCGLRKDVIASAASLLAGAAMLLLAWNIQFGVVAADDPPADCYYEAEFVCASGEACCNGVCYDPLDYVCTCDGTLQPISYYTLD